MNYLFNSHNRRYVVVAGVLVMLLLSGACISVPVSAPAGDAAPLTLDALKNTTYELADLGAIQLVDGEYEHQYGDGATMVNKVGFEVAALGDLNGDGLDDGAVVLWWNGGGSGTFKYLVAMLNQDGVLSQVGAELLGDRTRIDSLAVVDGRIVLDAVTFGPNDPMCCPSQQVKAEYGLENGQLVKLSEIAAGPQEVGALTSTSWILAAYQNHLGAAVDVLPGTEITADFSADQVTGKAGCNNYFASYEINDGGIVLGPVGVTRMACGKPAGIMEQEDAYLAALGMATSYQVADGRLVLLGESAIILAEFGAMEDLTSYLTDIVWIWEGFEDSAELNDIVVPYPPNYRLEFFADGAFSVQADCNMASGDYIADGVRLTLALGPTTAAECAPGSLYDTYLRRLGEVVTFVRDGDKLFLNLFADAGNLVFNRYHVVAGKIIAPEGTVLPQGAVVEIKMVDAAGTQVGGALFDPAAQGKTQFPVTFEAPYSARAIDPDSAYLLSVTIKDGAGTLTLETPQPSGVLTQGNPTYHLEVPVEPIVR